MGVSLQDVIHQIAREQNVDSALSLISTAARELTRSRVSMIGVLDEENGVVAFPYGSGMQYEELRQCESDVSLASDHGIVAHVAISRRPFRSADVRKEPLYRKLFETTISELAAPVFDLFGRLRAIVNCESDAPDAYTIEDEETILVLASLASVVLERQETHRREQALIQIGITLNKVLEEDELIDRVMSIARDVLNYSACSLFLYDKRKEAFILRGSSSSVFKSQIGVMQYGPKEGVTGWVCSEGSPVLLNDPQSDPRWRGRYLEFPSEQIASYLAVPVAMRGKPIGAIRVIRRKSENKFVDTRFTPSDELVLEAISEEFSAGLANVRNLETIVRSERMIAWGELSAKSSHMIGNRVFALKGDVNELGHILDDKYTHEELKEIQQSLTNNLTRIEEILREFRDFVGATQLTKSEVNLAQVVKESATEYFPRHSESELVLDIAENIPTVLGDESKLRRAIGELVENALHHIGKGIVTVRAFYEPGASAKAGNARIEVIDTGPGVAPDQKQGIFQPFHSTRVKGLGLGLSIVQGIVDAHGGRIYEDGEKGKGAKFVILLPVRDRP
ncbi:MAG: GAF domain-containing protein [Armatimonadetes bacterium]|nr:GAF domain-containing protein [Armatimonadota bacterium]